MPDLIRWFTQHIPVGPGSTTFEAGYSNLDLEDSTSLRDSASGPPKNAKETEGKGFYVQSGYYLENLNLQPWALYERWYSDASDDAGSWSAWRVGVSYFIKGHNANIKVGLERFSAAEKIGGSADKNIDTFLIGFYISYWERTVDFWPQIHLLMKTATQF